MSEYAERDHVAQGEHYLRHVDAMTTEGLHRKSAIAAELAHRDIVIEQLKNERVNNFWYRRYRELERKLAERELEHAKDRK